MENEVGHNQGNWVRVSNVEQIRETLPHKPLGQEWSHFYCLKMAARFLFWLIIEMLVTSLNGDRTTHGGKGLWRTRYCRCLHISTNVYCGKGFDGNHENWMVPSDLQGEEALKGQILKPVLPDITAGRQPSSSQLM